MVNENNKNAFVGMNIELLIKNSLKDHPNVIKKLKGRFDIQGSLENTAGGGIYGDKSDVRINFTCGHYIDANVKSFKNKAAFNQLARTTVSKFCDDFELDSTYRQELENIVVSKSKSPKNSLFSEEQWQKWGKFFKDNVKKLLEWGFSKKPNREILVLYNRDTSIVKIYHMREVLETLPTDITFTKGGFNIGGCVSFQRKGGNGSLSKRISKTTIQHPGNNVQLKVKINKLIPILKPVELAEYTI
ncbi:MAG: hypothetical protein LBU33_00655 [Endomicrobium sp.]|jgi:hypothetical protein|nr:hypothetical protein [Endomicrobium sp.]